MNYAVTEKATNTTTVMTDFEIEQHYGDAAFTEMLVGTHPTYTVNNISGDGDDDYAETWDDPDFDVLDGSTLVFHQ